jgi:glycerophosphoryl diester phosphodiesterase
MRIAPIDMPFPHIVAHRGASAVLPENTLPAFAVALAQGAHEVEFDAWPTADDQPVVCHDKTLDRATTGAGPVSDHTLAQIRELDAGVNFSGEWEGTPIPTLDEAFEFLAGRAFMNIHVKDPGKDAFIIKRIRDLAVSLGVTEQVYITGAREVLEAAKEHAPDITRCCLEGQSDGAVLVERAVELDCRRLQFCHGCTTDDHIRRARDLGLITNYYYADEPAEGRRLLDVGIMALLTNHPGKMLHHLTEELPRGNPA